MFTATDSKENVASNEFWSKQLMSSSVDRLNLSASFSPTQLSSAPLTPMWELLWLLLLLKYRLNSLAANSIKHNDGLD